MTMLMEKTIESMKLALLSAARRAQRKNINFSNQESKTSISSNLWYFQTKEAQLGSRMYI
jgi:hypothetical protein